MKFSIPLLCALLFATACKASPDVSERPMDEVPVQRTLANGDREYGFKGGCVVVLEPSRAVVKSESGTCALHHRDIALLYASAD